MTSARHTYVRAISALISLVLFVKPLPAQSDISTKLNDASEVWNKGEYSQALGILEPLVRSGGSESPEIGRVWILLGSVYQDLGRYPEAQQAYQSAISLFKRQPGREMEQEVAMDNLGSLYLDMGQLAMSKRLRLQVLRVAEAASDHAMMAKIYNNLTATALQQKDLKEGRKWLGHAFAEIKLAPRVSADDLAAIHSNAGWISAHDHDYEQASKYYEVALQSWTEQHGMNHPMTGWGYVLRGRTRALMGNASEGLEDVKTGLAIIEKAVGTAVPLYFGARLAYADVLSAAGSAKEAKAVRSITKRSIESFSHSNSSLYTISADAFR
jgi:tetratricopeptide (TPR) repeat protein